MPVDTGAKGINPFLLPDQRPGTVFPLGVLASTERTKLYVGGFYNKRTEHHFNLELTACK